mgnify:CR=1 FL=1
MKNLTETEFKFYDQCETIANYMEEHLYNTIMWQLPLDVESDFYGDENYANEMHAEAMEQVIAIMATRMFNRPRRQLKIINTNDND